MYPKTNMRVSKQTQKYYNTVEYKNPKVRKEQKGKEMGEEKLFFYCALFSLVLQPWGVHHQCNGG